MTAPRIPLLIGEAPARGSNGAFEAFSRSGERLARLLGRPFDAVNLLARPLARGESWPRALASTMAASLYRDALADREVVLLGRRVARAFLGLSPHLDALAEAEWYSRSDPTVPRGDGGWARAVVWVAPHPSGTSRHWNDAANRHAARAFFRRVLCTEEWPGPPTLPTARAPMWELADTSIIPRPDWDVD